MQPTFTRHTAAGDLLNRWIGIADMHVCLDKLRNSGTPDAGFLKMYCMYSADLELQE